MTEDLKAALQASVAATTIPLPADYTTMTWQERRQVREQYIVQQNGKCQHCGNQLAGPPRADIARKTVRRSAFPKGFFERPIHLHHSHDTGLTIGAVHAHCNAVLWQYHGE